VVISGGGINDRGEIAGSAFDQNTGDAPAFLAIPVAQSPVVSLSGNSIPKVTLPETSANCFSTECASDDRAPDDEATMMGTAHMAMLTRAGDSKFRKSRKSSRFPQRRPCLLWSVHTRNKAYPPLSRGKGERER